MISVLLPFTNERMLLKASIDSILCQSYRDFELLLIDNAADSISGAIAAAACEQDSRCRLLNEAQKGIAHALNHGIRQANGAFIARMDADDLAHPERLKLQIRHLEQHPETGVLACRTAVIPLLPENEGLQHFVEWQNTLLTATDHAKSRFIESPVAHPSVMARRELFEAHGGYSTESLPEDYELWLRWMQSDVRFEKLPDVLLTWRDSASRLTRTHVNYSEEAFFNVKAHYIKQWWMEHVDKDRPVIVCGGSRNIRSRIDCLRREGIPVAAVTDVVTRRPAGLPFIPAENISAHKGSFVINLIAKRDIRDTIRIFLSEKGFREMEDFIMAG